MICRECEEPYKPLADSPLVQFPETWICGRCQDWIDQMIRDEASASEGEDMSARRWGHVEVVSWPMGEPYRRDAELLGLGYRKIVKACNNSCGLPWMICVIEHHIYTRYVPPFPPGVH